MRLFLIDEDPDVLSNRILLGDDAKAKAGVTLVERRQNFSERRTLSIHRALPGCVGAQWAGDMHRHRAVSATSTE